MPLEIASTTLLGGLAFWWGLRFGRMLLRHGATANDLFKGKTSLSLAFLGLYVGLLLLALYVPQWQWLPLEWRAAGMRVTWTAMRVMLLGVCGVAAIVSWQTVRIQVLAVALLGLLGMGSFVAAETYVLAPIYPSLEDKRHCSAYGLDGGRYRSRRISRTGHRYPYDCPHLRHLQPNLTQKA